MRTWVASQLDRMASSLIAFSAWTFLLWLAGWTPTLGLAAALFASAFVALLGWSILSRDADAEKEPKV